MPVNSNQLRISVNSKCSYSPVSDQGKSYRSKKRLQFIKWLCSLGCIFCFIFTTFCVLSLSAFFFTPKLSTSTSPKTVQKCHKDSEIILLWTNYFSDPTWENVILKQSKLCNCIFLNDRAFLPSASSVIFHWRDIDVNDLPAKQDGQKFVWYLMEAPPNTGKNEKLRSLGHYFDCWATYRKDSDIYIPYGKMIPKKDQTNLNRSQVSPSLRKRDIAWVVSNCYTSSRRENYAAELSKFVETDIYGRCKNRTCGSSIRDDTCWKFIEDTYKFYLAFENSICKDYLTEKIFRTLLYDIVPIVMGGADYYQDLPPHSFIDALNFTSPQRLAKFLADLSHNQEQFNSYLTWKDKFSIEFRSMESDLCKICNHTTSNQFCNKKSTNLYDWWFKESKCQSSKNSLKIN